MEMMASEKRYAEWLTGVKHLVYEKKVLKQTEIAEKVGVQKEHINAVMRDRRAAGDALQDNISAALGLSYDSIRTLGQLILGGMSGDEALKRVQALTTRGKPLIPPGTSIPFGRARRVDGPTPPPLVTPHKPALHCLPVISFVQAGEWTGTYDIPPDEGEWTNYPGPLGSRAFALRVSGPSMEPEFIEGDIIIVDPDLQVESGDYVIAKNCEEEATFKRYYRDGDRHFLVPENPDWGKPMEMTGRDWRIIGKVVGKIKKY